MSYSLEIGEFGVQEEPQWRSVRVDIPRIYLQNGKPSTGLEEGFHYSNIIFIPHWYSDLTAMLSRCGLSEVLGELIQEKPGARELTSEHLAKFRAAQQEYAEPKETEDQALLDWLVFWTEYALNNCKYPTISIT